VTLAALHDIGKITPGFLAKCPVWLADQRYDELTVRQISFSTTDHARASQFFLQELLKPRRADRWAIAVGAHHGTPKGLSVKQIDEPDSLVNLMQAQRKAVAEQLIALFGPLPECGPATDRDDPALWLLAGMITVADWIGSNESFFSPANGQSPEAAHKAARDALAIVGWPGGKLKSTPFSEAFQFPANAVQEHALAAAREASLVIIEAPMGCGKTEAALALAQKLIASGQQHGLYFALPTQVTSNRIHDRVAKFLQAALANAAHLRLAHGNSWLHDDHDLRLEPSFENARKDDAENPSESIAEARSWFASSKHALLAPYGVGTIDQALQGMVAVKYFFVRRFALAGKVVVLDEVHSYDVYTSSLLTALVRELIALGCTIIVLSATLTSARRRELLAAIGSSETDAPKAYPLISTACPDEPAMQAEPMLLSSKSVRIRTGTISEDETIAELITRAEAGQHVLWIRNTVVEAQQAFRFIRGDTPVAAVPGEQIHVGLLHSRFPQYRRSELEDTWLDRLGKSRPADGPGSILVATQVVEQSVDIDLDFIVSDLAPTDMLFQRVGRLWRHPRSCRAASEPEFWVRVPELPNEMSDSRLVVKALGRSADVYAPWVLLRTAAVFAKRNTLDLPSDIRPLLEATYADPLVEEPASWHELHDQLTEEKHQLTINAAAAMLVLGRPAVDDKPPEALTRRKGPPTTCVLLLRTVEPLVGHRARLTKLDDSVLIASEYEWSILTARLLHPWLVRVPRHLVPGSAPSPRWLRLHVSHEAVVATLGEDGRLLWDGKPSELIYHPDFGICSEKLSPNRAALYLNNDDEFDY
jgi:CRISPR-associated endonuclease/helicase Cas3